MLHVPESTIFGAKVVVDIDDTLGDFVGAFVAASNREWGRPNEQPYREEDYTEHWGEFWRVPHDEVIRRYHRLDELNILATLQPFKDAFPVLYDLKKRGGRLTNLTSRTQSTDPTTQKWLKEHYPDIFDETRYSGIFESHEAGRHKLTKGKILKEMGAYALIDDQPKHCNSAIEEGVPRAILIGDRPWSRNVEVASEVVRCVTWQDVGEYFNESC